MHKLRILHLLSQWHLTGAETYAANLCQQQLAEGHQCWIISDTLTVQTDAIFVSMPIHNRHWLNRIKNIWKLIQFCKQNQIDVIHAHSRAASWLVNVVRRFVPVGYVSTVHGFQSIHFSSQKMNVYGERVATVCENLQTHLVEDLHLQPQSVNLIRNGF